MFEFTFNLINSDPFYITHNTNTIDNELIQFLNQIDFDFTQITSFTVSKI